MNVGKSVGGMKTVLFVLTEDWFFISHFQPMARALAGMGLHVVVAARQSAAADDIQKLGYRFVPIDIGRSGLKPLGVLRSILALRKILQDVKPDIVHAIALPPVVVTALATALVPSKGPIILAPTGLGHLWIENDLTTTLARAAVRVLILLASKRRRVRFLFENDEDPAEFSLDANNDAKVTIVGGAGVSPIAFAPSAAPEAPPMRVAVIARMIGSKGILPTVNAVRKLRATGRDIRLDLYGTPDPSNKRSITEATLAGWTGSDGITWHGHVTDVGKVWAQTHVAVLLSWREGLPRGVVEAMACGRPIVTTNVTGCRALVTNGIEGFIVKPEDADATAAALQEMYDSPDMRNTMGLAARRRFENGFTEDDVEGATRALYVRLNVVG